LNGICGAIGILSLWHSLRFLAIRIESFGPAPTRKITGALKRLISTKVVPKSAKMVIIKGK
jgi:hypothetical protein